MPHLTDSPPSPDGGPQADPPTPRRRRRAILCLAVVATYPPLLLGLAWQTDLARTDTLHVACSLAVFMVRTFSFHLALILVGVLAWVGWRRDLRLALLVLPPLVIALGPELNDWRPRRAPPATDSSVRVMHQNLLRSNHRTAAVTREIEEVDADLVVLLEYTDHWDRALAAALGEAYPHVATQTRPDSFGWGIYSRMPFVEPPTDLVPADVPNETLVRAVISLAGRPVALYAVHLNPPKDLGRAVSQRRQLLHLRDLLSRETLPLIVCGDFNFTGRHRMNQALIEIGLRDAHQQAGWGRQSTWPALGPGRLLPGVRIDHIYLGNGLACTELRTGTGPGSDHRPVIAEIGSVAKTP